MPNPLDLTRPPVLDRPAPPRRPFLGYLTMLAALGAVGGLIWAWEAGYRPAFLAQHSEHGLQFVEVDQGDVIEYIVENGTLESATNTVVRCEVEALMGMVGGATGAGAGAAGTARTGGTGTSQGGTTAGTQAGAATTGSGGAASSAAATSAKSKASSKAKTASKAGSSSSSSSTASKSASSSGSSSASASTAASGSADAAATGTTGSAKPMIRSFSYMVTPYVPLRGATAKGSTTTAAKGAQADQGAGGRGRRGGGGNMFEEKPGSTRIVTILPEGTRVKKGQVVCELDGSAFKDEIKAQLIRYLQAKSWVDQSRAIFEVNEITLREYRDGIFPQDKQLIAQYIQTCRIEKERAERNLAWSRDMAQKGFRTSSQLQADILGDQQTSIALEEAQGMLERLDKFTGPKILKSLEAKVKAITADRKNQEASFELEKQRLNRLQKCLDNCILKAPEDGILVYVNQTNGWGRVESQIEQGVTVREGQPIFQLPDPERMRVKARINETKVAQLRTGQEAIIKVDAFPDQPLHGTVAEITAISAPVNGPFSDVRIFYATVNIDSGFQDLRPGLTAEVFFKTDTRSGVNRLPLQAVRSIEGKHYVAVRHAVTESRRGTPYRWKRVELGLSDPSFVEVVSGVNRGDRIVADPMALPPPESLPDEAAQAPPVASLSIRP